MRPEKVGIKGPQGPEKLKRWPPMPEPQEKYEANDTRPDIVDGNFTQDPFSLKAPETDHTPNHTREPKQAKPNYGHFDGSQKDGMDLKGGY